MPLKGEEEEEQSQRHCGLRRGSHEEDRVHSFWFRGGKGPSQGEWAALKGGKRTRNFPWHFQKETRSHPLLEFWAVRPMFDLCPPGGQHNKFVLCKGLVVCSRSDRKLTLEGTSALRLRSQNPPPIFLRRWVNTTTFCSKCTQCFSYLTAFEHKLERRIWHEKAM